MSDQLDRKSCPSGLMVTLVAAGGLGEPLDRAARLDAIEVGRHRVVARAGEVDPAVLGIDVLEAADFPGPGRELGLQVPAGVVMVKMLPAVAFAEPEERAVVEPMNGPRAFDPGLG